MPATLKEFESVFPKLVEDLKQECIKYKLPEQALTWFEKVRPTCEGRDERMNERMNEKRMERYNRTDGTTR